MTISTTSPSAGWRTSPPSRLAAASSAVRARRGDTALAQIVALVQQAQGLLQTQMRHCCTVSTFNELIVEAEQAIRVVVASAVLRLPEAIELPPKGNSPVGSGVLRRNSASSHSRAQGLRRGTNCVCVPPPPTPTPQSWVVSPDPTARAAQW
jgi:hypothetical protein